MKAFRACCLIVGLTVAALASPATAADLVVVASTAPGLAPGQVVNSDAALDIPAGTTVTLLAATGKTSTLTGPHAGPPGLGGDGAGNPDLIASLSGLLAGTGSDTTALGTMRAIKAAPPPTDPWVIDIGKSGAHCVAAGGKATLWRGREGRVRMLSVIDLKDNRQTDVEWPAGSESLAWPAAAAPVDGGRYLIRMRGRATAAKVTLRLVPAGLATDAHRAAWMADHGCREQARRLLAKLR